MCWQTLWHVVYTSLKSHEYTLRERFNFHFSRIIFIVKYRRNDDCFKRKSMESRNERCRRTVSRKINCTCPKRLLINDTRRLVVRFFLDRNQLHTCVRRIGRIRRFVHCRIVKNRIHSLEKQRGTKWNEEEKKSLVFRVKINKERQTHEEGIL